MDDRAHPFPPAAAYGDDSDAYDYEADDPFAGVDYQATALRYRADGWVPQRQYDFLTALAECGCVTEACARVGMSPSGAYALRRKPKSSHFRRAWDAAMDHAVRRLSDAVFSRALNGTATPIFYKGELIGERRTYDNRLAMFILRTRDPVHHGRWIDHSIVNQAPDGPAALAEAHARDAHRAAQAAELGLDLPPDPLPAHLHEDDPRPDFPPLPYGRDGDFAPDVV